MKRLIELFFPKYSAPCDHPDWLTRHLSRSAEVSAFNLAGHVRAIDTRTRGSLATAFAIRVTRPLAMEAVS